MIASAEPAAKGRRQRAVRCRSRGSSPAQRRCSARRRPRATRPRSSRPPASPRLPAPTRGVRSPAPVRRCDPERLCVARRARLARRPSAASTPGHRRCRGRRPRRARRLRGTASTSPAGPIPTNTGRSLSLRIRTVPRNVSSAHSAPSASRSALSDDDRVRRSREVAASVTRRTRRRLVVSDRRRRARSRRRGSPSASRPAMAVPTTTSAIRPPVQPLPARRLGWRSLSPAAGDANPAPRTLPLGASLVEPERRVLVAHEQHVCGHPRDPPVEPDSEVEEPARVPRGEEQATPAKSTRMPISPVSEADAPEPLVDPGRRVAAPPRKSPATMYCGMARSHHFTSTRPPGRAAPGRRPPAAPGSRARRRA